MAHSTRREARQIKHEGIAGRIASGNHLSAQNDEDDAIVAAPAASPAPYSRKCSLCGDSSAGEVCCGCARYFTAGGTL